MSGKGETGINTPITFAILLAPRLYAPNAPTKRRATRVYESCLIILIFENLSKYFTRKNKLKENTAARTGQTTHVVTILVKADVSVALPANIFQPMMAPTTAWDVDTGSFILVIQNTVNAAANATVKEPAIASTAPSLPRVWEAPAPLITAPIITKIDPTIAAVVKRSIFVPTAVPNIFAASLAPSDQPRNNPLERKIIIKDIFYLRLYAAFNCCYG